MNIVANHPTSRLARAGLAALTIGASACSGENAEPRSHESTTASVVGVDEYLYFRCNATAWGVDDGSRLLATEDPTTFTLTYEVTEPWMVSFGDSCSITRTNQLNGWGSNSQSFGLRAGFDPLQAPGSAPISANTTHLRVRYAELGTYTARVNWQSGVISVEAGSGVPEPSEAAAQNAQHFYDYLLDRFGWAGIDGAGEEAPIVIGSGPDNNAQWTGATLIIGNADGVTSDSFAYSRDMIAHELVHAINTHTANIRPDAEAGAVNESFADVIAVFSTAEDGVADWRVGETVWTPAVPDDALRNLEDPHIGVHRETLEACSFDPNDIAVCGQAKHLSEYVNFPGSGGEHLNQGILNRAAYLLVEGGEGVSGIGVTKAEQIYFRALTEYLYPRVTFTDARHLLGVSCQDLTGQFGITPSDCASIGAAFDAVGIAAPNLSAPAGISGMVTAHGAPAVAELVLMAGASSPPLAFSELLRVTSNPDGSFLFDAAAVEAALEPPLTLANAFYRVDFANADPNDLSRVARWQTEVFTRVPYAAGTVLPSFDLGGLSPMTTTGDPATLPVTFAWSHRVTAREYYRWNGQVLPSAIHITPALTVTQDNFDDLFPAGSDIADTTEWSVTIRSYGGVGATNAVPVD